MSINVCVVGVAREQRSGYQGNYERETSGWMIGRLFESVVQSTYCIIVCLLGLFFVFTFDY